MTLDANTTALRQAGPAVFGRIKAWTAWGSVASPLKTLGGPGGLFLALPVPANKLSLGSCLICEVAMRKRGGNDVATLSINLGTTGTTADAYPGQASSGAGDGATINLNTKSAFGTLATSFFDGNADRSGHVDITANMLLTVSVVGDPGDAFDLIGYNIWIEY